MSQAMALTFEQVGGRCKLVTEDDFKSCLKGEIFIDPFASLRAEQLFKDERRRHRRALRQQALVAEFLKKNQFHEVNTPKVSLCGLHCIYPLAHAVKTENGPMALLLVRMGADPTLRDWRGYTALDRCKSPSLRRKMVELYQKGEPFR
ncbi:unnamed protein product [Effrenium voratum]|uniref:ANK_REP_REGION domain-containing protein n=1 Tax=Effrenium voratum TaxID=2562239 RepID=A0AA36I0G7_9DINO|nr:unnamed protein product [Effrenium voratum]